MSYQAEEVDHTQPSELAPSSTDSSLSSLYNASFNSKDDSNLSYNSLECKYKTKDNKIYNNNGNPHHYHDMQECYQRSFMTEMQVPTAEVKMEDGQRAVGGISNVASLDSQRNTSVGQLRSYSSGYSSGLNRDKIWIEMYDGYGNEMRKKVYSDTLLIRVKHDLMEIAEKWKHTSKRGNYKILEMEKKFDLCALAPVFLEQPVKKNTYFRIQYI